METEICPSPSFFVYNGTDQLDKFEIGVIGPNTGYGANTTITD